MMDEFFETVIYNHDFKEEIKSGIKPAVPEDLKTLKVLINE